MPGREELLSQNLQGSKSKSAGGKKKNTETLRYGNNDGHIKFGHLHLGSKSSFTSDVTSGVMLQAFDSRHYMTMDNDGARKGWTLNRCPGPYEIWCATDVQGRLQGGTGAGYFLLCDNGDVVISAPNGRIRMSALDIDLRAEGPNNTMGSINLDANQSINLKAPTFDLNASVSARLFATTTMNIVSNTSLSFASNFINGFSCASKSKPNKAYGASSTEFDGDSNYSFTLL